MKYKYIGEDEVYFTTLGKSATTGDIIDSDIEIVNPLVELIDENNVEKGDE